MGIDQDTTLPNQLARPCIVPPLPLVVVFSTDIDVEVVTLVVSRHSATPGEICHVGGEVVEDSCPGFSIVCSNDLLDAEAQVVSHHIIFATVLVVETLCDMA